MWFRSRNVDVYDIDTSNLTRTEQVAACRATLEHVGPVVERFQCDVPWGQAGSWPDDVKDAAEVLAPRPNGTPPDKYLLTGWVTDFSVATWRACVTFAPYAYDSDAYTVDMKFLAQIDDEGTSVAVRVLPEELERFRESLPAGAKLTSLERRRR